MIQRPSEAVLLGTSNTTEIPALDGLRALAILLVFWCHANALGVAYGLYTGPAFIQGMASFARSGVMLFFVLSGFLLFLPFARTLLYGTPWPDVRKFYQRRALRILPAYLVVLALLLTLMRQACLPHTSFGQIILLPFLLQDLRLDAFSLGGCLGGQFWSLPVEWQFYIWLPWLALTLTYVAGPRQRRSAFWLQLAGGLVGILVIGLSLRWLAIFLHYDLHYGVAEDVPGVWGLLLGIVYGIRGKYMEVFVLGIAVSLLYVFAFKHPRFKVLWQQRLGDLCVLLSGLGIVAIVTWFILTQSTGPWPFPVNGQEEVMWQEWAEGLCYALLLLGVLWGGNPLRWVFSLRPLRYLGKISYSLYLWHWTILGISVQSFSPASPFAYGRYILVTSSILFLWCSASYYLLERPFLRWRQPSKNRQGRNVASVARQSFHLQRSGENYPHAESTATTDSASTL